MKSFADTRNQQRIRVRRPPGQVETLREAWELAHEDACAASETWREAGHRERGDAYHAYVAAADREAAAAELLRAGACRQRGVSA
jgi:hypothetical protein